MKFLLGIFFLSSYIFVFQYSNKISIIEYGISNDIELKKDKKEINKNKEIIGNALDKIKETTLQLIFTKEESIFKKEGGLEVGEEGIKSRLANVLSGVKGLYYRNISAKEFLHQKESFSKLFLIDISKQEQNWTLTKESKMIGEYKCYKAVLTEKYVTRSGIDNEREIEAWYAPEIPEPYGPLNYGNLPGLILELTKKRFTYYAKSIKLNVKDSELKITKPTKGEKLTTIEFNDLIMKLKETIRF
ncbi:GLPGLI family protein [Winogradskyella wichelsiae]|uniref:GLPGLI family protein n=1 Tax=Winogradskyella wichelsiae TaxID=2697007 RepID=UPI0015CE9580|nr:GLPGLI family protein [Winogradskyella wichelsiae]